jgi:hypothetical protein
MSETTERTDRITWTVIGFYDNDGQSWAQHVEATDPHEAMRFVSLGQYPELVIVGAVPGKHMIVPPCEDSGKTAFAGDLARDEEGAA